MNANTILEAQETFCKNNKVPMFASLRCNHAYKWNRNSPLYGVVQTFDELMIEAHGNNAHLIASTTHVISCPVCNRSWCD